MGRKYPDDKAENRRRRRLREEQVALEICRGEHDPVDDEEPGDG